MDGMSSVPKNVKVLCNFDTRSHEATVRATWDEPDDPQGMVLEYSVTLVGNATYQDEQGRPVEDRVGPISKAVMVGQPRKFEFPKQPPNTQFFVRFVNA